MFAGISVRTMIRWALVSLLWVIATACHNAQAPSMPPTVDIRVNTFVYHTNAPLAAVNIQVNHRTTALTDAQGTTLIVVPLGHQVTVSVEKTGYRAFIEAEETAIAYEVLGFWLEPDTPDVSPR